MIRDAAQARGGRRAMRMRQQWQAGSGRYSSAQAADRYGVEDASVHAALGGRRGGDRRDDYTRGA